MAQGESRRWFLLVEDNEDEERLALRAFKRAVPDGQVTVARDGEEAQEILQKAGADVPLFVLLDIKLPKVSGLEVLEWMRKHRAFDTVPAIVLIGSVGSIDLGEIYRLGANSLVRKELEYESYMEKMVPTFKYWWEINSLPSRRRAEPV